MADLEEEDYIAKMIEKGHSAKAAQNYWNQKTGSVMLDDDDGSAVNFGGQILKARDPDYPNFGIDDAVPNRKRRAVLRTERIIDEENDRMIDIFKGSGVPVVRKVGDHRRYETRRDQ